MINHPNRSKKQKLIEAAKRFLASAPSDFYGIGYQENRQALAQAIKEAKG